MRRGTVDGVLEKTKSEWSQVNTDVANVPRERGQEGSLIHGGEAPRYPCNFPVSQKLLKQESS